MKRRRAKPRRLRRNPAGGVPSGLWWAAAAAGAGYMFAKSRRKPKAPAAVVTQTVVPAANAAPTDPVSPPSWMLDRYRMASQPGYVGVRYGYPTWNGASWVQAE